MIQNYEKLVDRISRSSGLGKEDIERKIEAKRAKLSGLISKEGAAQVVASELGISFDKEKMKIGELMSGMKKVNIVGKIIQMFPVRSYSKEGREGKIGSFVLADETSNVRTVLWDTNHISLIEKNEIKEGDVIEIANASMRNSEIHLTGFSDIKLSAEKLDDVVEEKIIHEKNIKDMKQGENVGARAFIVQMFEPRFFTVCPMCRKKVSESGECAEHGKVTGDKRALLSLVLDDGTETMRAVLFSDQIEKVIPKEELEGDFSKRREELLGKEMIFSGQVRKNQIYDNLEFFVNDWKDINIDNLIEQLEKK
jgi:hypothetical protein